MLASERLAWSTVRGGSISSVGRGALGSWRGRGGRSRCGLDDQFGKGGRSVIAAQSLGSVKVPVQPKKAWLLVITMAAVSSRLVRTLEEHLGPRPRTRCCRLLVERRARDNAHVAQGSGPVKRHGQDQFRPDLLPALLSAPRGRSNTALVSGGSSGQVASSGAPGPCARLGRSRAGALTNCRARIGMPRRTTHGVTRRTRVTRATGTRRPVARSTPTGDLYQNRDRCRDRAARVLLQTVSSGAPATAHAGRRHATQRRIQNSKLE